MFRQFPISMAVLQQRSGGRMFQFGEQNISRKHNIFFSLCMRRASQGLLQFIEKEFLIFTIAPSAEYISKSNQKKVRKEEKNVRSVHLHKQNGNHATDETRPFTKEIGFPGPFQ